jgi:hypothetical protein
LSRWLAIIAISAGPLVYVAWLANPLVLALFGIDWWLERVARLYPLPLVDLVPDACVRLLSCGLCGQLHLAARGQPVRSA